MPRHRPANRSRCRCPSRPRSYTLDGILPGCRDGLTIMTARVPTTPSLQLHAARPGRTPAFRTIASPCRAFQPKRGEAFGGRARRAPLGAVCRRCVHTIALRQLPRRLLAERQTEGPCSQNPMHVGWCGSEER
jgi:hypothetical protein